MVDTEGLRVRVVVSAADLSDRDGMQDVCLMATPVCPRLELIWVDGAYTGMEAWAQEQYGWQVQVVSKLPDQAGFVVLPRRWVVERTFGWRGRNRRLSKDDEEWSETSEAWVYAAMIKLMLRRLAACA